MSPYEHEVEIFSLLMLGKLNRNAHKGKWEANNLPLYLARLKAEVAELQAEIVQFHTTGDNLTALLEECADVANFALIISNVARRINRRQRTPGVGPNLDTL